MEGVSRCGEARKKKNSGRGADDCLSVCWFDFWLWLQSSFNY